MSKCFYSTKSWLCQNIHQIQQDILPVCLWHHEHNIAMNYPWSNCPGKCLLRFCPSVWPMNNYTYLLLSFLPFLMQITTIYATQCPGESTIILLYSSFFHLTKSHKMTPAYELSLCTFRCTANESRSLNHAINPHNKYHQPCWGNSTFNYYQILFHYIQTCICFKCCCSRPWLDLKN